MNRDVRLSLEQSKRLTRVRALGTGRDINITLSDGELAKLLRVIVTDLERSDLFEGLPSLPEEANGDYYAIPLKWFETEAEHPDLVANYVRLAASLADFETYFECLCELHKRRRKYAVILSAQPLPTMVQVSPRSLMEYGGLRVDALASWLTWRKWFYDIDNRAAQETGYLFEPILASSLGGTRASAGSSPIRRRSDQRKGRQVDCIVGKDAYEFKLRVTIAASGQGRFGEELAFAEDCRASGYRPVLLVLDPTPNPRLSDLKSAFERHGGVAFIGEAAWAHIREQAGPTMATFVERYVHLPIAQIDHNSATLLDLSISTSPSRRQFRLIFGSDVEWHIDRYELAALEAEVDDQPDE
ncbi:hypothetical protein [Mesorhizobium sp. ESP-6-2]|uniref:hypothetical protein n=1 Tax=Mesorhizobium sp. ESP-6-2 TaxID=2876625 RepID=UPI001CCE2020|nr:hypothetical protein [Mesorhizobium sp. ESP-6-2]MBZ9806953.1 hypothetical protein [Mesorhizobium sp. ESP-6-2]